MTSLTPEGVLELARRRGVALAGVGDRHKFRGPEAAVAGLKPLLLEHKPGLLALLGCAEDSIAVPVALAGNEPWDRREALGLMAEAEALVEWLGANGWHPAIVDATALVASAFATGNIETVRFAATNFVAAVRGQVVPRNGTLRDR